MSRINYVFNLNKNSANKDTLLKVTEYLKEIKNIPSPKILEQIDVPSQTINGWDLKKINECIINEEYPFFLSNPDHGFTMSFILSDFKIVLTIDTNIFTDYYKIIGFNTIREIIKAFTGNFEHIECFNEKVSEKIYEEHIEFTQWSRTFLSSQLEWLQYYNHDELKRQGGDAIFENPYIKAERLCGGILVQVGESLEEAYSPEGQELLVKATKAMPPVQQI